jgi:hypothetical protein
MTVARTLTRIESRWGPALAYVAIVIGFVLSLYALGVQDWVMSDGLVYREAGERLRTGEPLYLPADADERSYRYAPWFALAWSVLAIPDQLWLGLMAICAVISVIPALRAGWFGVAIGALVFPYLLIAAMGGHVQPAIAAALVYGLRTRWGPLVIAIVASLKFAPILFAGVYLARRQWGRGLLTLTLAAVLTAPILLFDLSAFPTSTAGSWGLFEWSPILWAVVVVGLAIAVWMRPSWLAAATLTMLAIPKFVYYDVSYLLVGVANRDDDD